MFTELWLSIVGKKPTQSCLVSWHDVTCYAGNQVSWGRGEVLVTESQDNKRCDILSFCSPKVRHALGNEFLSSCAWNSLVVTFCEWKGSINWWNVEDTLAHACLSVQSRNILCSLSYSNSDWYNIKMPELPFQYFCLDQKQFGMTAPCSVQANLLCPEADTLNY